ncbi:MAG: thioredoxin family protein [Pseudomonadota bacterium]
MAKKATFYHAGCPVCVEAEQHLAHSLDKTLYSVEYVHLGNDKNRIREAESLGVKSVPALVLDGFPFHINFGAGLDALK